MTGYAIFDLDGCISDDRHRRHLLPNYKAYHSECANDDPKHIELMKAHIRRREIILILTGRNESMRSETKAWLTMNFGLNAPDYILCMRPDDNEQSSVQLKPQQFRSTGAEPEHVVACYDDRPDVLDAYRTELEIDPKALHVLKVEWPECKSLHEHNGSDTAERLEQMAATFRERNAIYGDNYLRVADVMRCLFPDGVPSEIVLSTQWHLFELIVVKLTRFANADLAHEDSIHDIGVYAAMIENELRKS